MRKVYGIGETVYDIIFRDQQPQKAVPGGSTFNCLISLGRCGLHPTMVTETGDDHVGSIITDFMRDNGVATDFVTVNTGTKTHVSLAFLDNNNDAQYQFYKDHASAVVRHQFPDFKADDIVIFGSFFAVNPVIRDYTRKFLQRAHDAGCILYYDINFRAAHIGELPSIIGNIEENIRLATIVRGSTEDFHCLYGLTEPDAIYQRIAPLCPRFILTDGANTVTTYFPEKKATGIETIGTESAVRKQCFEVKPINTISTIGAGDNFNAGIAYHIITENLSRADLNILHAETVVNLVASGERFAAQVCQSLDNYIPDSFAKELLINHLMSRRAFLFDLDGVIIDTEGLYQQFWGSIGAEFLPHIPDFATRIKGSTLVAIHKTYFPDPEVREEIDRRLNAYEDTMRYTLFPGAEDFVRAARAQGIPCAIVTSSNQKKMDSLGLQLPALTNIFDQVFTAEDADRGKPFPDCYLKAAEAFGLKANECAVFEDSINGLRAAYDSGAFVVGLTTTHPVELVRPLSHLTVNNLAQLNKTLHFHA